jgi:hypothetical protein
MQALRGAVHLRLSSFDTLPAKINNKNPKAV